MTELRLRLLGTPEVTLDGRPAAFRRRTSLPLLAYLATTGRRYSRSMLNAFLAGDLDEARAQKRVRNVLTDVHMAVGEHVLVTREWVAFDRERPHWIDVADFEAHVAAKPNPLDAATAAEAALDLYSGEFLTGLSLSDAPAFDEWLVLQRERLRLALVQALQAALAVYVRGGAAAAAGIATARRLLELEPWSEDGHRALMTLLARSGQRGAALAQYAACRKVLADELGIDPSPETAALAARLQSAPAAVPHNLPARVTSFVGRQQELDFLATRLADPACRLVTLVGLGGSGKTALAIEAARHCVAPDAYLDDAVFPDGVFVVELGEATADATASPHPPEYAGAHIAAAIGRVVGAPGSGTTGPIDHLAAAFGHLRSKRCLLVVDRMDHHLAGSRVLSALLQQAIGVKLLVTSRVRLRLQGETVCEVRGLPAPAGADDLAQSAAGQLFLEEAARAHPDIPLGGADQAAAAEVCRLLDGHPLALLLAANNLRGVASAELAADLAAGSDLPAVPLADYPARHHSLRAVLDDAWAPLTDAERTTLCRLAVFHGRFSRDAATAVADAKAAELLGLVDAGLLDRVDSGRYGVNALVHRYATERLAADPVDSVAAAARHAAYYAASAGAGALSPASSALEEPIDQFEDVCAAWDWSVAHHRFDLVDRLRPTLVQLYDVRGHWAEAAHRLGAAAERLRDALAGEATDGGGQPGRALELASVLAACLVDQAHFQIQRYQLTAAGAALHEARGFAAAFRWPTTEAWATLRAGQLLHCQGQRPTARRHVESALQFSRMHGLQQLEGEAARALASLADQAGDGNGARTTEFGEHALQPTGAASPRLATSRARAPLGEIATEPGSLKRAEAYLTSTLVLADQRSAPVEPVLTRLDLSTAMGQGQTGPRQAGPRQARPDAIGHHLAEAVGSTRRLTTRHDAEIHVPLTAVRPHRRRPVDWTAARPAALRMVGPESFLRSA